MRRHLLVLAGVLSAASASASGFYNMPTSFQQCLGVGFGPGYHAPMVLGCPLTAKIATQPIRWTGPLKPRPSHAFGAPSSLVEHAPQPAYGCQSGVCHGAPHGMVHHEGALMMAPPAMGQPTPAPPRDAMQPPIFAAPANPHAGYEVVPGP